MQLENTQVNILVFKLNDAYIKLMFDTKTGLLVKQERELNEGIEETFYKDYRSINKVMEPFSIKVKKPTSEIDIIVDKVEYNTKITETTFRYPSADGSVPIPDVEALLKQLETNQEKIKELRELYSFRSTQTETELEGNGQVKKTTTKVYDVTPIAGTFVERLVNIDGRQLSPSEQEKEDKKVKKEIEEAKKEQKKREQKKKDKKDKDDDGDISILTFLKIVTIKDARRDKFRDQNILVFDFEPRKDYKPKNLAENIVSKLVGTMFIDEQAKQVVRLEARLSDSVKLAGGLLATLSPSSAFVFEQEKIRDEIWLPSYSEIHFGARALLFVKVNQNQVTRYSDYKKYQTDVEIKSEADSTSEIK
jgi:predicted transcriptional regulator